MAVDGEARATVRSIVEKVKRNDGEEIKASEAGLFFSEAGLRRVAVNGERRLVLDIQLLEAATGLIETEAEEAEARLVQVEKAYAQAEARVQSLEERAGQIRSLVGKETELRQYLEKHRGLLDKALAADKKLSVAREKVERIPEVERSLKKLESEAEGLKAIEEKEGKLKRRIADLEAREQKHEYEIELLNEHEQEFERRVSTLGIRKKDLERKVKLVDFTELDLQMKANKKELDEVLKVLGEKKTLMGRLLGRSKGPEAGS